MILKLLYAPFIFIQMIILDSLFGFALIYCVLNVVKYRAKDDRAQHSHDEIYN
jgi:hypothetical protein